MSKGFLKVLCIVLVIDIVCSVLFGSYVIKKQALKTVPKSHVAVILMGNFNQDYSFLGNQTLRRLNYAIELYKNKKADQLLCVGGARPKRNKYGSELMRDYLLENGVNSKDVFIERNSFDTKTNWYNALDIIYKQKWKSIVVISSALHLFRLNNFHVKTCPQDLKIVLAPFPYRSTEPRVNLFQLWGYIHYEWIAAVAQYLPRSMYDPLIQRIRNQ